MRAEVGGLGGLVGDRHRVIQIHPDFLDDHLLLGLEILLGEVRTEDVREHVEGLRQILGQAGDVVKRVLLRRLRVVLGPHPVEVAVDRERVAPGVPLKTMCSRKCETPATSVASSRLLALTKKPEATEWAWSFTSAMTRSPLSRTVWWNCMSRGSSRKNYQRTGASRARAERDGQTQRRDRMTSRPGSGTPAAVASPLRFGRLAASPNSLESRNHGPDYSMQHRLFGAATQERDRQPKPSAVRSTTGQVTRNGPGGASGQIQPEPA